VISPHDAVQNHPLGTQAAPVCEGGVFAHPGADHRWPLTRRLSRLPTGCDDRREHRTAITAQIVGGSTASL